MLGYITMKFSSIKPAIIIFLVIFSVPTVAKEDNPSCIYINEQAPIYKNKNIIALLLESAFIDNNCPRKNKWSIKGTKIIKINDITVLYNNGEDINLIKTIANKNLNTFKQHLPIMKKDKVIVNFAEASMPAYSASIERACNITIKLTASKNKKLWLISNKAIQRDQYCLNTAIIFAGHYINLKYTDGVFHEYIAN
jgi:hypothetical protein